MSGDTDNNNNSEDRATNTRDTTDWDTNDRDTNDRDTTDRDTNDRARLGTGADGSHPVLDSQDERCAGLDTARNWLAGLGAALDEAAGFDWSTLGARGASDVLKELERCRRRLDATGVAVVGETESHHWYRYDGFRSPKTFVAHVCGVSPGEASRRVRAARCLSNLDTVNAAYATGNLGVEQLDVIARLHANARVRDPLIDAQDILVEDAQSASYRDFRALAQEWERLADIEGSLDDTERHHANRQASLHQDFDGSWTLTGGFGAAQGVAIAEIFERFVRLETDADWEKAKAEHGEGACIEHLPRTDRQRRADALWNVFVTAAATPPGAQRPEPLVDIIITQTEFEEAVARSAGAKTNTDGPNHDTNDGGPTDSGSPIDTGGPVDHRHRRCSTLQGHPIDPADAYAAAMIGHIRRVVLNAQGVVINLGRRARLFTGGARDAALLAHPRCVWVGCDQTGAHNQIDHSNDWQHHGPTNQDNAGPLCRFHNRWKSTHGYRTWRDPTGTWHTYHPNGHEIT